MWNVERMAARLGLGEKTFARLTEACLGISAKQWMRQVMALRACRLLREGWKVSSVGRELGFENEGNFSAEFKKLVGISPSRLQGRYREDAMGGGER